MIESNQNFSSQILTFVCFTFSTANPVPESTLDVNNDGKISTNELFQQINSILQSNIHNRLKDESTEVGDKIQGDEGKLQIQVQQFKPANGFPISFQPSDDAIIDDIEVIPVKRENDGDGEEEDFILKKDTTESSTDVSPTTTNIAQSSSSSTSTESSSKATIKS